MYFIVNTWGKHVLKHYNEFVYLIQGVQLREACVPGFEWISGKFPKGGGVISDPKNFIAIFFALETVIMVLNLRKKSQWNFPKKGRGGGQRPFGNFPEIHPFWYARASLRGRSLLKGPFFVCYPPLPDHLIRVKLDSIHSSCDVYIMKTGATSPS